MAIGCRINGPTVFVTSCGGHDKRAGTCPAIPSIAGNRLTQSTTIQRPDQ